MKGQTVEQSDLVGDLKGFPIEVVQEIVNEQVRQGNKADVEVFQEHLYAGHVLGGFDWANSVMGKNFLHDVLSHKRFDTFFQKYPKTQSLPEQKCVSIEVPDGYEIDNEKSTFTNIVFKPIACKFPKSWEDVFSGNPIQKYDKLVTENANLGKALCNQKKTLKALSDELLRLKSLIKSHNKKWFSRKIKL